MALNTAPETQLQLVQSILGSSLWTECFTSSSNPMTVSPLSSFLRPLILAVCFQTSETYINLPTMNPRTVPHLPTGPAFPPGAMSTPSSKARPPLVFTGPQYVPPPGLRFCTSAFSLAASQFLLDLF
jgi:hypothetical protein